MQPRGSVSLNPDIAAADISARGTFWYGWSPALLIRDLTDYSDPPCTGLKRLVSHGDDRPLDFVAADGYAVDLTKIFPVMILRNSDERFYLAHNDGPDWLPVISTQRFLGEQSYSIRERNTLGTADFGLTEDLLKCIVSPSQRDFALATLYGAALGTDKKVWKEEIFDPTGTYFNFATKYGFDQSPTTHSVIRDLAHVDKAAGHIPPNGMVQDLEYFGLDTDSNYCFSVYFKAGDGTSSTMTHPVTSQVSEDFSTFLVKLQYYRPDHWTSWSIYNPSGHDDNQPTHPSTGVVNEDNASHWDTAQSLPYVTLRFCPGTGASSVQVNNTGLVESTKLEDAGGGWWRASVALRWRQDWVNKSTAYDSASSPEFWHTKEQIGGQHQQVNGLRVTLQYDKPTNYTIGPYSPWANPGQSVLVKTDWKVWGSLFHKGDTSEVKDFKFLEGDLFVGDIDQMGTMDKEICYLDSSGNVFTGEHKVSDISGIGKWGNIQKLTTVVRNKVGLAAPQYNVNTQVSAMDHANADFTGGYFYLDQEGNARDLDGNAFTSITDKTYGSLIEDPRTAEVEIQEQELLVILRYFNSLTNGFAARRSESVSGIMDLSGGGRLNYRTHPYQMNGQISTQAADYDQITRLDITN